MKELGQQSWRMFAESLFALDGEVWEKLQSHRAVKLNTAMSRCVVEGVARR